MVQTFPFGVHIEHELGEWSMDVTVPKYQRGGFAYEFFHPDDVVSIIPGWHIRIVHTAEVRIYSEVSRDVRIQGQSLGYSPVSVYAAPVTDLKAVPPQGEFLDPKRFAFRFRPPDKVTLTPRSTRERLIYEILVGVIPYVGDVYDVAQFAYSLATGRDFWGADVSNEELVLMGLFAIVPLIPAGAGKAAKGLDRLSDARELARMVPKSQPHLAKLLAPEALEQLRKHATPEFRSALESLGEAERKELIALHQQYAAGKIGFKELTAAHQKVLASLSPRMLDHTQLLPSVLELLDDVV